MLAADGGDGRGTRSRRARTGQPGCRGLRQVRVPAFESQTSSVVNRPVPLASSRSYPGSDRPGHAAGPPLGRSLWSFQLLSRTPAASDRTPPHKAVLHGIEGGSSSRRHSDLDVDVLDVSSNGLRRDEQRISDSTVSLAACQQAEDLHLAVGQTSRLPALADVACPTAADRPPPPPQTPASAAASTSIVRVASSRSHRARCGRSGSGPP